MKRVFKTRQLKQQQKQNLTILKIQQTFLFIFLIEFLVAKSSLHGWQQVAGADCPHPVAATRRC